MSKQHIIELNGKRYDALTGKLLSDIPQKPNVKPLPQANRPANNMDGFATKHRVVPAKAVRHATEKSKTLMRKSVHAPSVQRVHAVTGATPDESPAMPPATLRTPAKRVVHAHHVPQSKLIKRFNSEMSDFGSSLKRLAPAQPAVVASSAVPAARPHLVHADPISVAMAKSTSHDQPKLRKPRLHKRVANRLHISPRLLSFGALSIAVVLLIGFFTWQNIPNLSMRLATSRSGVHSKIPGYEPAGFSMSRRINYKPGQIVLSFKSNSDSRNFTVTQATSTWDSSTLLENYVAVNNRASQTIQDKGKTIYIYDGSNASWVDGGIWYRVEGSSSLNSDQLLSLAGSM